MNEYDSNKMLEVLSTERDVLAVESPEEADLLLLNTCSIREKPQEKVFSELGRWNVLKRAKPGVVIGVAGCVASQEGSDIVKRARHVDMVFGPQTLHRLPSLLKQVERDGRPVVDTSFPEIEKFDVLPAPKSSGASAYVSIMEGCSKYCSFCVVPYTRGEEISRPVDQVLTEIMSLVDLGAREIHLLGQNVNAYRGALHGGGVADLALLIHYIAAIEQVGRIRYTTSHPVEFSESLIEAHRDLPKLVRFLHLPVQSGSDRVLAMMKRGHTVLEYKSKVRALRAACPDMVLSSDFIVGFPGESEQDFEATMQLAKDVGIDHSFSFIYSARPGTPAAYLPDTTPLAVKKARLARLQALINEQAAEISEAMVGTTQRVLIERPARRGQGEVAGRTENNRIVNFVATDPALVGQFVEVTIVAALRNSLRGELRAPTD